MQAAAPTQVSAFVGERLRAHRKRHHVAQSDVAEFMRELGFTWDRTVVTKIEKGRRRMTVDELVALCYCLDVSVATLLPDPPHG